MVRHNKIYIRGIFTVFPWHPPINKNTNLIIVGSYQNANNYANKTLVCMHEVYLYCHIILMTHALTNKITSMSNINLHVNITNEAYVLPIHKKGEDKLLLDNY